MLVWQREKNEMVSQVVSIIHEEGRGARPKPSGRHRASKPGFVSFHANLTHRLELGQYPVKINSLFFNKT